METWALERKGSQISADASACRHRIEINRQYYFFLKLPKFESSEELLIKMLYAMCHKRDITYLSSGKEVTKYGRVRFGGRDILFAFFFPKRA